MNKTTKKPRGAPKKDNPATARFEVRCTPEQKKKWEAAAKEKDPNLSLSAWLKILADNNS